jgi:hypothetical protein
MAEQPTPPTKPSPINPPERKPFDPALGVNPRERIPFIETVNLHKPLDQRIKEPVDRFTNWVGGLMKPASDAADGKKPGLTGILGALGGAVSVLGQTAKDAIIPASYARPDIGPTVEQTVKDWEDIKKMKEEGKSKAEISRAMGAKAMKNVLGTVPRVMTMGVSDAVLGAGQLIKEIFTKPKKLVNLLATLGYGATTIAANIALTNFLWNAGVYAAIPGAVLPMAVFIASRHILNHQIHKFSEKYMGEFFKDKAKAMRQVTAAGLSLISLGQGGLMTKPLWDTIDVSKHLAGTQLQTDVDTTFQFMGDLPAHAKTSWNIVKTHAPTAWQAIKTALGIP